jgi:hypothetical protein
MLLSQVEAFSFAIGLFSGKENKSRRDTIISCMTLGVQHLDGSRKSLPAQHYSLVQHEQRHGFIT